MASPGKGTQALRANKDPNSRVKPKGAKTALVPVASLVLLAALAHRAVHLALDPVLHLAVHPAPHPIAHPEPHRAAHLVVVTIPGLDALAAATGVDAVSKRDEGELHNG